jgi:xanthine dehydrogenase iron-sulfur cluster and FAD-binding subunit A
MSVSVELPEVKSARVVVGGLATTMREFPLVEAALVGAPLSRLTLQQSLLALDQDVQSMCTP